jgi:exopolysaccharide/PEP-CTERM locus tyrosine autokinase
MSKIQEALNKLQGRQTRSDKGSSSVKQRPLPKTVIPIVENKYDFPGIEKHHLEEKKLIAGGLLAPLDRALPISDQFRRIKRPLLDNFVRHAGDHMNVILVSSSLPGAGKTFCSVNLAASISLERELSVLLVDADVAKRHISRAFGLGNHDGLIDILEDDSRSIDDVLVHTDLNDIKVLPSGRTHAQATELLASYRMEKLIDELATRYSDRIIIVDSPPLLITSEAQALAQQVGQIALVIESGKTGHEELVQTLETLDERKPINAILNKSIYTQPGGYYGGGYGYYGFND